MIKQRRTGSGSAPDMSAPKLSADGDTLQSERRRPTAGSVIDAHDLQGLGAHPVRHDKRRSLDDKLTSAAYSPWPADARHSGKFLNKRYDALYNSSGGCGIVPGNIGVNSKKIVSSG